MKQVVVASIAVLVMIAALGGYLSYQHSVRVRQEAAAVAAAAKQANAVAVAKAEGSKVLAKIEECESAVTVGVSLEDLSDKASAARAASLEFGRTQHAKTLPDFAAAASLAAEDYTDSCSAWFESNRAATAEWEVAYDKWDVMSDKPAPDIDDYKDDSKYQALWEKAGSDLATARSLLESEGKPKTQ